jgi:hypothetical protein
MRSLTLTDQKKVKTRIWSIFLHKMQRMKRRKQKILLNRLKVDRLKLNKLKVDRLKVNSDCPSVSFLV